MGTRAAGECFHSFFEFSQTLTSVCIIRRQKAIPWDAWDLERSIRMNCEVKLIATINQLDRL